MISTEQPPSKSLNTTFSLIIAVRMNPVGKLVKSQFEAPRLGVALAFFLLPFILQLFFSFIFGSGIDLASFFVRALVPALLSWLVSAAILYILLLGFKGKAASGKFFPALAGLSVFNLVYFFALLIMSVLFFFAVPQLFQNKGMTSYEVFNAVYSIASQPQAIHWVVLIAGLLIGLGVAFSYLYIAAKISRLAKETSAFSDSLVAVIFAFASAVAFALISGFFWAF